MKKFLLPLSLAAVFFILCFTGCNNSAKNSDNDGWIEVQSISYVIETSSISVTSTYTWEYKNEEITQDEFCQALNISVEDISKVSSGSPTFTGIINVNRTDFIEDLKSKKETESYYLLKFDSINFYKCFYIDYSLSYLKIKFYEDGSLDLQYQNEKSHIKPASYKITYFND